MGEEVEEVTGGRGGRTGRAWWSIQGTLAFTLSEMDIHSLKGFEEKRYHHPIYSLIGSIWLLC